MTSQGDVTRTRLMQVVRADPGMHVRRLAQIAGLAWTTCEHHLRCMEEQGLVSRRLVQGRWRVYASDEVPASSFERTGLMRDPRNQCIVDVVTASPGQPQEVVSALAGLPQSTLSRRMACLEEAGLIKRRRDGRSHRVFPSSTAAPSRPPMLLEVA